VSETPEQLPTPTRAQFLRILARAFRATLKDPNIRAIFADQSVSFAWVFEDLGLRWGVVAGSGKVEVRSPPPSKVAMTFYHARAEDYHLQQLGLVSGQAVYRAGGFRWKGDTKHLKLITPLTKAAGLAYPEIAAAVLGGWRKEPPKAEPRAAAPPRPRKKRPKVNRGVRPRS